MKNLVMCLILLLGVTIGCYKPKKGFIVVDSRYCVYKCFENSVVIAKFNSAEAMKNYCENLWKDRECILNCDSYMDEDYCWAAKNNK